VDGALPDKGTGHVVREMEVDRVPRQNARLFAGNSRDIHKTKKKHQEEYSAV
jgi:hypothetical protein